jgi:hypothetical protein
VAFINAVFVFFGIRIGLSLVAVLAAVYLPEQTGWHATYHRSDNIWLDVWARWDSEYYLDIAQYGYGARPELPAFFPVISSLDSPGGTPVWQRLSLGGDYRLKSILSCALVLPFQIGGLGAS